MYKRILFLISCSYFVNAKAELLTLESVMQKSVANNPSLKVSEEKINQVESNVGVVKSTLFPNLSWTLSTNRLKDAVYTGSPKFNGEPYNTYGSDVKLTQTLYAYGSLSAVKQAEYDKQIQTTTTELSERTLKYNVINYFYIFILNQNLLKNLNKTKDIIEQSLSTANERYRIGRGQLLDVLQVKTQLELINPQIEQAKNQVENAANQLSYYMGEKERGDHTVKGELRALYLKDVQGQIDLKKFYLPEYEINRLQLEQLKYAKESTLGKEYPTLKLVGDYLYNNYKKADLFSDYSHAWSIQLQLNIPLFNGLSSVYESRSLNSQHVQLVHAQKELENNLSLNQIVSMRNLMSSETSLVSAIKAAKLAEDSQKEANRNYKLATIDFLQFLSVEQASLQAKNNLEQLKYQNIMAYANYFIASGQPLETLIKILVK